MKLGTIITILFLTFGIGGCTNQKNKKMEVKQAESKTVEQTLMELALKLEDASLLDEPPGELHILEFSAKDQSTIRLILDSNNSETLFSIERKWDKKKILQAKVLKATEIR